MADEPTGQTVVVENGPASQAAAANAALAANAAGAAIENAAEVAAAAQRAAAEETARIASEARGALENQNTRVDELWQNVTGLVSSREQQQTEIQQLREANQSLQNQMEQGFRTVMERLTPQNSGEPQAEQEPEIRPSAEEAARLEAEQKRLAQKRKRRLI